MNNPFKDLGHQIEHVAHDVTKQVAAQKIVDTAVDYLATDGVAVAEEAL